MKSKSGRAVSRQAGEPYKDKLLALPQFLTSPPSRGKVYLAHETGASMEEILAGLRLTGYFLDSWLLTPHNRKLPATRQRLLETLEF